MIKECKFPEITVSSLDVVIHREKYEINLEDYIMEENAVKEEYIAKGMRRNGRREHFAEEG